MRGALPCLSTLVLLTSVLLGPDGAADEEPSPAEAGQALVATFPVPSAAHTVTFRGNATIDGQVAGTLDLQAKPLSTDAGVVLWGVTEHWTLLGGGLVSRALAVVDRSLAPVRGAAEERRPGSPRRAVEWQRIEDMLEVRTKRAADVAESPPPTRHTLPAGACTTTLPALALLTRHALPDTGTFEVTRFHPAVPPGVPPLRTWSWVVATDAEWRERPAWSGSGRSADGDTLALFFEPTSERLLGIRLTTPGGSVLEAQARPEEAGAEVDPFASPARSAEAAALQAALAFATADLPLIEAITHWPSVHARARARYEAANPILAKAAPFPDVARFRNREMERFAQGLRKRPRQVVEMRLRELRLQVERRPVEDGLILFTFPAAFDGLRVVVGAFDGAWRLVGLPAAGR